MHELNDSFTFVRTLFSTGQENERNDNTFTKTMFTRLPNDPMMEHFICLPACLVESLMLRYRPAISKNVSNTGEMRSNGWL